MPDSFFDESMVDTSSRRARPTASMKAQQAGAPHAHRHAKAHHNHHPHHEHPAGHAHMKADAAKNAPHPAADKSPSHAWGVDPGTGHRDLAANAVSMYDSYNRVGNVMGVNPSYAFALGHSESGNNFDAVAGGGRPGDDNRALGPMQVLPSTAATLANTYKDQFKQATGKLLKDPTLAGPEHDAERGNLTKLQGMLDKPKVTDADMRSVLRDKNIGVMFGMQYMKDIGIAKAPMKKAYTEKEHLSHGKTVSHPAHLDLDQVAINRRRYVVPSFKGDVAAVDSTFVKDNPLIFGAKGLSEAKASVAEGIGYFNMAAKNAALQPKAQPAMADAGKTNATGLLQQVGFKDRWSGLPGNNSAPTPFSS